ncbi:ATP-binding protein [Streptomyces sp. NPDC060064]|uniref:ATP-binding protein n=1 Tax=Streptomyces sp. NPDC060064 TaxID=3347049 RepID=UPI003689C4E8
MAAELTANAVRHGHVPGRDFHLRLTATAEATLRLEVADTRTERRPAPGELTAPPMDAESGRGLYLVSQLAHRWGVAPHAGAPEKHVWAELRLPPIR